MVSAVQDEHYIVPKLYCDAVVGCTCSFHRTKNQNHWRRWWISHFSFPSKDQGKRKMRNATTFVSADRRIHFIIKMSRETPKDLLLNHHSKLTLHHAPTFYVDTCYASCRNAITLLDLYLLAVGRKPITEFTWHRRRSYHLDTSSAIVISSQKVHLTWRASEDTLVGSFLTAQFFKASDTIIFVVVEALKFI